MVAVKAIVAIASWDMVNVSILASLAAAPTSAAVL